MNRVELYFALNPRLMAIKTKTRSVEACRYCGGAEQLRYEWKEGGGFTRRAATCANSLCPGHADARVFLDNMGAARPAGRTR